MYIAIYLCVCVCAFLFAYVLMCAFLSMDISGYYVAIFLINFDLFKHILRNKTKLWLDK